MSISENKIRNIKAKDPIDILIFDKGLRIKNVIIDKELDLIAVILNSGKILESKISDYKGLQKASESQLNNWKLIGEGVGITWNDLNEDLSVKGFIKTAAISEMIDHLKASTKRKKTSV